MIVYKVTNLINNKCYIGYTSKTLEYRKKIHYYKYNNKRDKKYKYVFYQALRKYGFKNFLWEIIYNGNSKEDCCEKEIFYIKNLNTISPNGYNLTEGGNGGIASEETKLKISNSLKLFFKNNPDKICKFTDEERSQMAKKAHLTKLKNGYKWPQNSQSEESKLKMSQTKNFNNRIIWKNSITNEEVFLSCTDMAKYTNLSISLFCHINKGRCKTTKNGWYKGN